MCFTKDGKFRKFGFVGYKTEKQAAAALDHFNNSYIDTSKVQVQVAKNLGDDSLARPWSKHSKGSSANQKILQKMEKRKERKQALLDIQEGKKKKKDPLKDKASADRKGKKKPSVLEDLDNDEGFKDFLSVHERRSNKSVWNNDSVETERPESKEQSETKNEAKLDTRNSVAFVDSSDEDDDEDVYDATGLMLLMLCVNATPEHKPWPNGTPNSSQVAK